MPHIRRRPNPPLDQFIDCFWLSIGEDAERRECIVPSGTIELVINLFEDEVRVHNAEGARDLRRYSGAVVSGPYASPFAVDARQHRAMIGVHFRPGGAPTFLGMPANVLRDSHIELADAWGAQTSALRDQLVECSSVDGRFAVVENAMRGRFPEANPLHPAVATGLDAFSSGRSAIRDVVAEVGLSQRRFIQLFSAQVGLAPKLFCRILRFQRAKQLIARHPPVSWAEFALACGYFDQAHMINEFRSIAGVTPLSVRRHLRSGEFAMENHIAFAA